MEERNNRKKLICSVIIFIVLVSVTLPLAIGEGGNPSSADEKRAISSAPERVMDHPEVAFESDNNESRVVPPGENAVRKPYTTDNNSDRTSNDDADNSRLRDTVPHPRKLNYRQMILTGDIPPCNERLLTAAADDDKNKTDLDGDGLTDYEEETGVFGYKTDKDDPDTDDDGLSDLEEYWWLCNPTDPDTNFDWISDGDSVHNRKTYPYLTKDLTKDNDPDGDGLPTGAEKRYDTGTDYKTFSTDRDPYGDGQEFFGINMPSIAPADHPLVAAYPDLSVRLEGIKVTPIEEITSTTGGAKQAAWSITTETSDSTKHAISFEQGVEYTQKFGLDTFIEGAALKFHFNFGYSHEWTHTTTESKTESGWTQEDWSTAKSIKSNEAAQVKLTINVKNSGTAPAEEITPHVTLLMGMDEIATITSPTTINALGMGETSGNFVVDQGIVGVGGQDIILTLDELRNIDTGVPLDLKTFQVNAKVKRWDGETNEWVCTGTDYSTYMTEINENSATVMFVSEDGTYKKYKVFTGSDNDTRITLGDAFNLTIGRDDSIPLQENDSWSFGFPDEASDEIENLINENESISNLSLKPKWFVSIKPASTDPYPHIEGAYYTEDMSGVWAYITDDLPPVRSVIAHVKISGAPDYKNLTMTDDNGDSIYVVTTTDEMEDTDDDYILATDSTTPNPNTNQADIRAPPTLMKGPFVSGDYVITAKHSGKSLTVEDNSTDDRANVHQYTYWGYKHQKWRLSYVGDGYYIIYALHSGKCLEVADAREENGVNVRQNKHCAEGECTLKKEDNQKWRFEETSDGYYRIVNKNSEKCLDVRAASADNRANVQQWECQDNPDQQWVVQPVDSYPSPAAGYYAITAKHSGKCLAVNDSNVEQQEYAGMNSQRMELIPVGDGFFSISDRDSGNCLTVENQNISNSANVVIAHYDNLDNQKWKVESIGYGWYKICAKHSNKCLGSTGSENETNIHQYEYYSGYNQRWKFDVPELVTLYEDLNYGGKSISYQGVVKVPYIEDHLNDKISSLEVPEEYAVTLYEDEGYNGLSRIFTSNVLNLTDYGFNDTASSLTVDGLDVFRTGQIILYEGNDASQDIVCSLSTESTGSWDFTACDACDNDEARSAKLKWVKPGTKIYVYDSSKGDRDDDWAEIEVKSLERDITLGTFEESYENERVKVTCHYRDNLDGKVSRIEIITPSEGTIILYEGNNASQDIVCSLSTESTGSWDFTACDACDNDEARSAKLKWVKPGTKIYVYDNSEGKRYPDDEDGDDWAEIEIKRLAEEITIGSFESTIETDYVNMTCYYRDNLDGKVSRIEITAPS